MTYGRNDRRCKMLSTLVSGIECFCNHSERLQTILEGTKRCFDDINTRGKNETGPLVSLEVLHEAVEEILSSADKLPGIVVLGQNEYCKSQMVNELFQRTIFPTFYPNDIERRYRTVRFKYGENLCINLELPDEYSLAENLEAYKSPWNTIPRKDLEISENEEPDSAVGTAVLEVSFNHQLLRCGCTLVVAASNVLFEEELKRCMENISPILIYAFHTKSFTTKEIQDLELLKKITNFQPVCFVRVPDPETMPQTVEGDPLYCGVVHSPTLQTGKRSSQSCEHNNNTITENVLKNGESTKSNLYADTNVQSGNQQSSETKRALDNFTKCAKCDKDKINAFYLSTSSGEPESSLPTVSSPSDRMGKAFVTTVPPNNCHTIFTELCNVGYLTETPGVRKFSQKKVEDYFQVDSILVTDLHQFQQSFTTFSEQTMQRYLVNAVTVLNNTHKRCLDTFIICAFDMTREVLITPKKIQFARDKEKELFKSLMKIAIEKGDEIKEMIECTIADRKAHLIQKAHDYDFVGVEFSETGEVLTHKGLKICTGQIQELVLGGLTQAVASKLVNSVDIMRDSYTGTLTRCLESLEKVERENPGNCTTEALKQILNAAYQVEITVRSSSSIINILLQGMKQLVQAMPWSHSPKIDNEWKTKVAADMLANLSAARLAKSISSQIKDRLKKPHEAFLSALEQLDTKHVGRLVKIEEERLKLQKVHAPRLAKVALESTSLKDLILYGMPQMGKEISRGQYGVVHSCDKWAGHSPCAIKSVVPLDDKHLNDLALEFFYTKNIPDHDRVVRLHGSIIDYTYGGGTTPAVLLIMDRLQRDLHTAIEQRLDWVSLLQVSIDVVEGIRFLHSLGLVHRDIKLKNVLLDTENRGKITDLGFCKPEAMISGSIVGTPLHMAPELFTGQYDSSVDVYAFGILFWHVCAGNVRKPQNFEQFANKDQLSAKLKKGLRPEYLPVFDDECWELMSKCWENKPLERPVLGDVQQRLIKIYERYRNKPGGPKTAKDS